MNQTISAIVSGRPEKALTKEAGENPPLNVVRFDRWETLQPWADRWDELAKGVPFRSWAWQSSWWRQYGAIQSHTIRGMQRSPEEPNTGWPTARDSAVLAVLGVFGPDGRLVGLLPMYRQSTWGLGRVLRFLGSGEVCSEYLSMLCEPAWEAAVADALAAWLAQANRSPHLNRGAGWDVLEMSAVDAHDSAVGRLAAALAAWGHAVHCRPGPACWRVALAPSWKDFLKPLSRNRRRKFRLLEREFIEGRVRARCIEQAEEVGPAIDQLITFQRARRWQLRQATCFHSPRFTEFLYESAGALLQSGQLTLIVVEKGDSALAVELAFRGPDRLYAYQVGIDGSRLHESPGHLGQYALLRYAWEHGLGVLDLLRGDEPYKADWGAEPYPTREFRIAARKPLARLRHTVWRIGAATKAWVRRRSAYAR